MSARRYVYRLVVDKWPTEDGRPFIDQPLHWWERLADACQGGQPGFVLPSWLPADMTPYLPCRGGFDYPGYLDPPPFCRRVGDPGEPPERDYPGSPGYDVIAVPHATTRRRFQRAGLRSAAEQLRAWGCTAHVERAELGAWEAIP